MDKHLNDLIVGVPNHIESYSNQKVFVREKEDSIMAKRGCGASLLISKDEDGSCYVSARPQEFEPKVAAAQ